MINIDYNTLTEKELNLLPLEEIIEVWPDLTDQLCLKGFIDSGMHHRLGRNSTREERRVITKDLEGFTLTSEEQKICDVFTEDMYYTMVENKPKKQISPITNSEYTSTTKILGTICGVGFMIFLGLITSIIFQAIFS